MTLFDLESNVLQGFVFVLNIAGFVEGQKHKEKEIVGLEDMLSFIIVQEDLPVVINNLHQLEMKRNKVHKVLGQFVYILRLIVFNKRKNRIDTILNLW